MKKILILGLGNPGKKFERTRHNVGFRMIEKIRKEWKFFPFKVFKDMVAEISEGKIGEKKIILAKPKTFMNESGKVAKRLIENYEIQNQNFWVIHDDLDIFLGKFKISFGKGSAGHKGVQSIIDELKTKEFFRIRIGIFPEEKKRKLERDFVLKNFKREEEKILKGVFEKAIEALKDQLKLKDRFYLPRRNSKNLS